MASSWANGAIMFADEKGTILVALSNKQREWLRDTMSCSSCPQRNTDDPNPCCILMAERFECGPVGHLNRGSLVNECLKKREDKDMAALDKRKQSGTSAEYDEGACEATGDSKVISCDQEAWLLQRLMTLIRMAETLRRERHVGTDEIPIGNGIDGLVHGTAHEIVSILGMHCCHENIRRPSSYVFRQDVSKEQCP